MKPNKLILSTLSLFILPLLTNAAECPPFVNFKCTASDSGISCICNSPDSNFKVSGCNPIVANFFPITHGTKYEGSALFTTAYSYKTKSENNIACAYRRTKKIKNIGPVNLSTFGVPIKNDRWIPQHPGATCRSTNPADCPFTPE